METIISTILTILLMNGSVLIMPGINFMLIIRHAVSFGRIDAMLCACGVTIAIIIHVIFACYFTDFVLTKFLIIFNFIKYLGVGLLSFYAWNILRKPADVGLQDKAGLTKRKNNSFFEGLILDLFNPFVSLFYISLFSIIIKPNTKIVELWLYIFIIFLLTISWFLFVAIISSGKKFCNIILAKGWWFYRFTSVTFLYYAYRLATTKIIFPQ